MRKVEVKNNKMREPLRRYLKKNSMQYELECCEATALISNKKVVAVMPIFGEFAYLSDTLDSLAVACQNSDENILILLIVNNAEPEFCDVAKFADNQKTLKWLREGAVPGKLKSSIAWLDASSPGKELKKGGGVGAARKTGMDAALHYFDWDHSPLIAAVDGDTLVADNYFCEISRYFNSNTSLNAAVVSFQHRKGSTPAEEEAIRLYETYMDDYVEKLRTSHSPYAYHAMGSAIICRAGAYLKAGGMRPKQAGEDFYFLQALRKLDADAPIGAITGTTVYPSSRASDRVPFGTGARITELLSDRDSKFPGRYLYNINIFTDLAVMIENVENGVLESSLDLFYRNLPDSVSAFLDSCGFRKVWPGILKNSPKSPEKIRWAFHVWFDAFRTLKFIHFCELRNPDKYGRILNTLV